jgi:hypothetical protein
LRTNRETTPEGFHDKVLSDHITRNRETSHQVNDPQSLPAHEVARVRFADRTKASLTASGSNDSVRCHAAGFPVTAAGCVAV